MHKVQRKPQTPIEDTKKEITSATKEHDFVSDRRRKEAEKENALLTVLQNCFKLLPKELMPAKYRNQTKMEDLLEAIQALHLRFDTQDEKMADMNTELTQNTLMISSPAKALEFNAAEVKDCTEKIAILETEMSNLCKAANEIQANSKELHRHKRRWNLRIRGMKEMMGENTQQDVVQLLRKIVSDWAEKMDDYVDTVHRLGKKEKN
ncbi:hypothetical protein CRENBAI_026361 [Crenichthys baileyi]|uniref:Uncharacterized protein n=1 Tax=Crenichthys baileyi TaxID=28760 RepID=A0AAV9QNL7_9TELE